MLMMMVLAQLYFDCNMTKTKPSSFRIASFSVVIVINTKPSTIFFCTIAHPSNCLTLYDCMHIENYIADSLSLSVSFCARCILFYLCLMCMVSLTKQKVIRCMQWFFSSHVKCLTIAISTDDYSQIKFYYGSIISHGPFWLWRLVSLWRKKYQRKEEQVVKLIHFMILISLILSVSLLFLRWWVCWLDDWLTDITVST